MNVVGKLLWTASVVALCALHQTPNAPQIAARPANGEPATSIQLHPDLAFITAPEVRMGDPTRSFPRGSRLVRLAMDATGRARGAILPLTPQFFAAADPQVSFDGRDLLFAGQTHTGASWQIWEISADGETLRQVTHCAGDCVQPAYLPEREIAYTALHGNGADRTSDVQVSHDDGSDAHAITFGPGRFEVEAVLRSGRLLLSAESPLVQSSGAGRPRSLYILDPDGSGLMLLRQEVTARNLRSDAREMADGTIIFVQREAAQTSAGQLLSIRPGALSATPIERGETQYASAQALDDGDLVVSRRTPGQQFDLYRIPTKGNGRRLLLYRDLHASSLQAVAIATHPASLAYRSILHPERKSGRLVCLDAYASNDLDSGRLPRHIARVRVLTDTETGEKVLGEAPVELDGSFYATVPANMPIRLLLLGAKGEVFKSQRSWMWVRSGEDRGCSGCHESQAMAPENRSPMTLQRLDTPTPVMGDAATAPNPEKAVKP